jgi:hypothetical protein
MAAAHNNLSTFSSDRETSRTSTASLLIKLVVFALPFAIPFVLFTGMLIYTGESMPLSWVVRLQTGDETILYRTRYGNRDFEYKTLMTRALSPEIIAVGSSHVLQFRSRMFTPAHDRFYNAGAPAWRLDQVDSFIRQWGDDLPSVIVLALDHPWFNDAYTGDPFADRDQGVNDFEQIFLVNRSVLQDWIGGQPFDLSRMLGRVDPGTGSMALGWRAIRDGHGFRRDGSEQYGDFLVAGFLSPEGERARHLEWLANGEQMYVRGDTVSQARLSQLRDLLAYAQAHGSTVIGFLPPFSPTQYQAIRDSADHGYLAALPTALDALFTQANMPFFDFSDGAQLGVTDSDFFDGWHGSERVYLRMYLNMAQTIPEVLGAYSDPAFLQATDSAVSNTFAVFNNQF